MIRLLTGRTGSGKSYQAVSFILDALENNKKVFTNIAIDITDDNYVYIDELGVRKFLKYIEVTFEEVRNLDEKKALVNSSIYHEADFFIDEAHLVGFKQNSESIMNWLTIHRHFNQNITIITQITSNIHRNYLDMFHNHIDMIPPNKRLSKSSMGFKEYDSVKGERLRTNYFKPKLDIFELYSSGQVETGINQTVYKLAGLAVGMIAIVFVLNYFSSAYLDKFDKYDDVNQTFASAVIDNPYGKEKAVEVSEDANITLVQNDVVWCDTKDGCYIDGVKYSWDSFIFSYLPKHNLVSQQIVLSKNKWRLIRYAFKRN